MRITCPNCSAQFDVPDDAIKEDGRKLRCGQCKHEWHQLPVPENEKQERDSNTDEDANFGVLESTTFSGDDDINGLPIPSEAELEAVSKRKRTNVPWATLTLVILLAFIITSSLYWRSKIVDHMPPTALFYDKIGLHVPVRGEKLILQNIGAWRNNEQFMEILLVQGEIFNPTETIQNIPIIKGTEIDATGRELQTEYFTPEAATLLPNEVIKFEFQKPFPDENTVKIIVTFSDQERGGNSGY